MRRILFTILASALLVSFAPAAAQAKKHHHHHRRHHARVRHERFGRAETSSSSSSSTSGENDTAGQVASFQNDILTNTLNDGSTVSGRVTRATELECDAAAAGDEMRNDDHGGSGDDNGTGAGDDNGDRGNDNGAGDDENEAQTCDRTALAPGTLVREAELSVSSAGAVWSKVELVTSAGNDDSNDDNDSNDS
jgi:hypothetical protein